MPFASRCASARRTLCCIWILLILASMLATPAGAAGTGQISGTVTDLTTGAPIANAHIDVRSPSDHYTTTTDASGHFTLAGVSVDTYTISTEKQSYATFALQGVTVNLDETFHAEIKLTRQLKTIGRSSTARSITSAFQPAQTIDRTVVNAQGIDQLLGKSFDTNGVQLLSELPGVAIDRNGTPLIRGGTSFQGALEFEGIDYTEPNRSLTNRFENIGSNYLLNGVGSIEIIPGGGDATHGNTGTGLLALTAKQGTTKPFATLDLEQDTLGGGNPANQVGFEYGFATLKNTLSNYFTYIGENQRFFYGPYGTNAAGLEADPTSINPDLESLYTADQRSLYTTAVFNRAAQTSRDFIDNLVYKFGKDQQHPNQKLQFFVQSQAVHQELDYGGYGLFDAVPQTVQNPVASNYAIGPFSQSLLSLTGSAPPGKIVGNSLDVPTSTLTNFLNRFAPQIVGATAGSQLSSPETITSPFSAYKVEYDNNLNASTNLQFRVYRTDDAASEALPSQGLYVPEEGGTRRGLATDITKVLSDKNTLQFGGKYDFAVPFGTLVNSVDYTGALSGIYYESVNPANPGAGATLTNLGAYTHDIVADFLQPQPLVYGTSATSSVPVLLSGTPGCVGTAPQTVGAAPQEHCGYLYHYFPNGPPALPAEVETPLAQQQSYGLYAQDTYAPNSRLHVLAGLRLDGYNFLLPSNGDAPPAVDGLRQQRLYEPKFGISYRLGNADSIRANFGRSLSIPLPDFIGTDIDRNSLAAFNNVPSYDSVTGKAATYCGTPSLITLPQGAGTTYLGHQTCSSYADQLYWLLRDSRFAAQEQLASPLQGSTFTNYDFTYSHEFHGGYAFKLTPFYRRGYNVVETSQTLEGIDPTFGTQILSPELESNLGIQSAAGLEFIATTPQRPTGLSGTVTATYINQIGNDPPGNYLPTASIQLGELYHSPNIAPFQATFAGTYRTKWGLRINPILTLKTGYPYGAGVYEALTINGKPYYLPYTDAIYQGFYSSFLASANVDPQYPGTVTNPNVVAYRGTESATSGPGSLYSSLSATLDLVLSMTPPPGKNGLTYGVDITNLFDRTASVPYANYAYDCTLIYTGLCTGSGFPAISDKLHSTPQTANSPSNPYLVFINQLPIAVRFFVQAHL